MSNVHVLRVAPSTNVLLPHASTVLSRRQLGRGVIVRLVKALPLSRLNYCDAILANLPASKLAVESCCTVVVKQYVLLVEV